MNKTQAYNNFWNSFGLIAYDEGSVPDDAKLPYITFSVGMDDFDHPIALTASLWYRSGRWEAITLKAEEIANKISRGGITVPYDKGVIWIKKGQPFAQRVKDEDDSIRRIYLNIEVEFID